MDINEYLGNLLADNPDVDQDVFFEGVSAISGKGFSSLPTIDDIKTAGETVLDSKKQGALEYLGRKAVSGVEGLASGVGAGIEWAGDYIGSKTFSEGAPALEQLGKNLSTLGRGSYDYWQKAQTEGLATPDPIRDKGTFLDNPSFLRAGGYVMQALPSLAAAMGVSSVAGPLAGAALLGGTEGAPAYVEAKKAGAEHPGTVGALSTIGSTVLEYLPISHMMKGIPGGRVVGALVGGAEESAQEGTQSLWQNVVEKIGYNETKDLSEGIIEGMIGGFGSGAPIGGLTARPKEAIAAKIQNAKQNGVTDQELGSLTDALSSQIKDFGDEIGSASDPNYQSVDLPSTEPKLPSHTADTASLHAIESVAGHLSEQADLKRQEILSKAATTDYFRAPILDESTFEAPTLPAGQPVSAVYSVQDMEAPRQTYEGMIRNVPSIDPSSFEKPVRPTFDAIVEDTQMEAPGGATTKSPQRNTADQPRVETVTESAQVDSSIPAVSTGSAGSSEPVYPVKATIADTIKESGLPVKFDGEDPNMKAMGRPPLYHFTITEGPAKGASFTSADPTPEGVVAGIRRMEGMRGVQQDRAVVDQPLTTSPVVDQNIGNMIRKEPVVEDAGAVSNKKVFTSVDELPPVAEGKIRLYHGTRPERVKNILERGLLTGFESGYGEKIDEILTSKKFSTNFGKNVIVVDVDPKLVDGMNSPGTWAVIKRSLSKDDVVGVVNQEKIKADQQIGGNQNEETKAQGQNEAATGRKAQGQKNEVLKTGDLEGNQNPDAVSIPGVREFKTSKGSVYQLHDDGTTTRYKADRPEHPGDSGKKERSSKTVYVSKELAQEIGQWQTSNATGKRIALKDGKVFLVSNNSLSGNPGLDNTISDPSFSEKPNIGKAPLELWDESKSDKYRGMYKGNHPGNEIVSIGESTPQTARYLTDITTENVSANKQKDGKYTLVFKDSGEEVFPGKTFDNGRKARDYFREAQKSGATKYAITSRQALDTNVDLNLPSDDAFQDAVKNTPGAKITKDGLEIEVERYQKEDQAGEESIRTGVFYLPKGSKNISNYKGKNGYGGKEQQSGTTLIRNPVFVKGATGGKAPQSAYDLINGKGAYEKMRSDVLSKVFKYGEKVSEEDVYNILEKYGADGNLAWSIVENSKTGNTLPYAIQENIAAHSVRNKGYDAILGYSKKKDGSFFISEIFDLRETTYPEKGALSKVHPSFLKSKKGGQYSFSPLSKQPGITLKDVKETFPRHKVEESKPGSFKITGDRGSISVESVDHIGIDEGAFEVSYNRKPTAEEKARGAAGSYQKGTIKISKQGDRWSLAHESYHWLEDSGMVSLIDRATLNAAIRRNGGTPSEEARAKYVEDMRYKRDTVKGALGRVLQKIGDLVDGFVNLFQRTARGVVRDISSGKVGSEKQLSRNSLQLNAAEKYKIAYHGTPHIWPPEPGFPHGRPRLDKIGTGEGGAAYGFGWYSAAEKKTAETYKPRISETIVLVNDILIDPSSADTKGMGKSFLNAVGDMFKTWETSKKYHKDKPWLLKDWVSTELKNFKGWYPKFSPSVQQVYDNLKKLTAQDFQEYITETKSAGALYQLDIPDSIIPKLLDWDKPLSDQSEYVKNILKKNDLYGTYEADSGRIGNQITGRELYESARGFNVDGVFSWDNPTDDKSTSEYLASIGIPGNTHGGMSKGATGAKYVIWDQNVLDKIAMIERNGEKLDAIREAEKDEGRFTKYSVSDRKETSDTITEDSLSIGEKIKAAIFVKPVDIKNKKDLSYLKDLLISTPQFFAKKIPTIGRMYEIGQRKQDHMHELLQEISVHDGANVVDVLDSLKSADKSGYKAVQDYLVKTDQTGIGFRSVKVGSSWRVYNIMGKEVSRFESKTGSGGIDIGEIQAIDATVELEREHLKEKGFTDQQADAVRATRIASNKVFEILVANLRKIQKMAIENGAKEPRVTTGKDETVDIETAIAQIHDLRGVYFPRIREKGAFVLIAKKKGEDSKLETFATRFGTGMNLRRSELEKQGWTVTTKDAKTVGEDVFALEGSAIKTQQLVNAAIEKIRNGEIEGVPDDVLDIFTTELSGQVANIIRQRGPRAHMTQRSEKLYTGYETDPAVAMSKYIVSVAGGESKRVMTGKLMRAFTGTDISLSEFKDVMAFDGDYDAFLSDNPDANPEITESFFKKHNAPEGVAENITAIEDAKKLLEKEEDPQAISAIKKTIKDLRGFQSSEYKNVLKDRTIDQTEQSNAFKWGNAFIDEMTRNTETADKIIGSLRSLAVVKYISTRVFASPLVNVMSLPTSVIASLKGAGIPYLSTWNHLGSGIKDYGRYRTGKTLAGSAKEIFDIIHQEGWNNPQFSNEALSKLRGSVGRGYDAVIEKLMWTFSESEKLNRSATIAAAYYGLKKLNHGKSVQEVAEMAKKVSDDSHGVYNKGNYPYLAMGNNPAAQVAKMFYVFRTFAHTYYQNMAQLGFKGEFGALAHMVISPAIVAGAGASVLMPLIKAIMKGFGSDDPEEDLYDKISKEFGHGAGRLARHGLVGAAGGVSLKGSMAVGVLDVPTSIADLVGAPGSVLKDIYDGGKLLARGDVKKGAEKLSPSGVGNIIRAYREYDEGVTNYGNAPVFFGKDQLKPTLFEAVQRGMSFNPSRLAEAQEKLWSEKQIQEKYQQLKSDIHAKVKRFYLQPVGKRSKESYASIANEIQEFNGAASKYNWMAPITDKSIKRYLKRNFKPSKKERLREE